ncbi:MAG: threonine synthase [Candidatus Liptonbacteria bacterium]|nr:threonine synthase [Candidatus Liptonbacteria bacterium]
MKFHSTSGQCRDYSLEQVLTAGLAPDGGLFMPDTIPSLPREFIHNLPNHSFAQIATRVAEEFMCEVPPTTLQTMIRSVFDFPAPLKKLRDNLYILELFHGPTLAFKDFGARFLARALAYFLERKSEELNIIVATSGDTGSAVASGFFRVPHIRVFILYPSGRVSPLQERQLTTYGENVTALEVQGSFDDCQALAKAALNDPELTSRARFSSANSINFGRLLPQSFYYFHAAAELQRAGARENPVIVVPSGNFGNLTAGLLAHRLGLPVKHFVAATNRNRIVPDYLATGHFEPRPSEATLSNAMDVGNPSNFARMLELYQNNHRRMARDITGAGITDTETRRIIQKTYHDFRYLLDPHTAVGVAAAFKIGLRDLTVVLATAHPAKFREVLEPWLRIKVPLPKRLSQIMHKKKKSIIIKSDLAQLKQAIRSQIHV